jgi:hypothetical protein
MNPTSYATAQQLFLAELVRNLFSDNRFLLQSRDWSTYTNGKTVNFPQAGALPGVVINNDGTVALTPAGRADINRTYNIEEYQSIPTLVDWTEEMVINYAKRQDVIEAHKGQISDDMATRILFKWISGVPAANIVRTSGADKAAVSPSATGTRKKATLADFAKLHTVLTNAKVPNDQRRCVVVPAYMYEDLLSITEFLRAENNPSDMTLNTGAISKALGFNVFVRDTTTIFNNASTPVAQSPKVDATLSYRTAAAADNQAIIAWHPAFVTRAISPQSKVSIIDAHGGTEVSATMLAGGHHLYSTMAGVAALVEAVGA